MRTPALALLAYLLAASQVAGQNDTVPKHTLEVQVFDKHTMQPLTPAELVLHSEGTEIMRLSREDTVPFRTELPYLPKIDGVVSVPGHLHVVFSVRPADHAEETVFIMEVFLIRVISCPGPPPDALFARNSAVLSAQAKDSIAIIEEILGTNPTIVVELGGHVDATEDEVLAMKRCEAVQDHLIGLGIPKGRIPIQAHGKQRPWITADQIERMATEEEREAAHAVNRRVDFKVVGSEWVPDTE